MKKLYRVSARNSVDALTMNVPASSALMAAKCILDFLQGGGHIVAEVSGEVGEQPKVFEFIRN